jgi:glyoxylase-like metal-dependent hydrolase (beta-lactamase superfamily II)
MENKILVSSGKINEYIHFVDLYEFGIPQILSAFIGDFEDSCIIMDCGSSLDVEKLIIYLQKADIPLEKVEYLITSHHHFDHNGGMWKLYEKIKRYNSQVKILTNITTKELLNDHKFHLARGERTYGEFVGKMKPIKDEAFEIITPSNRFTSTLSSLEYIKSFKNAGEEIKLVIFHTPGHTPDHQSIAFIRDEEIDFIFFGEAVGTLYHSSRLVTTPTSMPIFFDYETYMDSFYNLTKLKVPSKCGFGHFGVVNGKKNVAYILNEHEHFMKTFHEKVITYYNDKPKTKYVFNKIKPFFEGRYDVSFKKNDEILDGILLGLVYGMMMSLGYRTPAKHELKKIKKYRK